MLTVSLRAQSEFPQLSGWEFSIRKGESRVILGSQRDGLRFFERWLPQGNHSDDIEVAGNEGVRVERLCLKSEWDLMEEIRKEDDSEFVEGGFDPGPSLQEVVFGEMESTMEESSLCDRLGITPILGSPFRFLSNGEIRKSLLLRAVLRKPDMLMLASPYEGLDSQWRRELDKILLEISSDCSVILMVQRQRDWPDWIEKGFCLEAEKAPALIQKSELQQRDDHGGPSPLVPSELLHVSRDSVNDDEPLVEIRSLSIRYGERNILKDFAWSVEKGENWLVTGGNGLGKTTLMDVVYADHNQSYGQDLSLFGIKRGSGESVWDLRRFMGRVNVDTQRRIQNDQSVPAMVASGMEDTLGLRRPLRSDERIRAQEWLELLGIGDLAKKYCHQLDYGDLRAVLMARALIKVPRLLILDEPSQGLSQDQHQRVIDVVGHILDHCACSVLYVTHHPYDAPLPFTHHLELVRHPEGHSEGVVHRL